MLRTADGRRAFLAFTGLDSMRAWRVDARPVPVTIDLAAKTARSEGVEVVLIDVSGPEPLAIDGEVFDDLAQGHRLVETAPDIFGRAIDPEARCRERRPSSDLGLTRQPGAPSGRARTMRFLLAQHLRGPSTSRRSGSGRRTTSPPTSSAAAPATTISSPPANSSTPRPSPGPRRSGSSARPGRVDASSTGRSPSPRSSWPVPDRRRRERSAAYDRRLTSACPGPGGAPMGIDRSPPDHGRARPRGLMATSDTEDLLRDLAPQVLGAVVAPLRRLRRVARTPSRKRCSPRPTSGRGGRARQPARLAGPGRRRAGSTDSGAARRARRRREELVAALREPPRRAATGAGPRRHAASCCSCAATRRSPRRRRSR